MRKSTDPKLANNSSIGLVSTHDTSWRCWKGNQRANRKTIIFKNIMTKDGSCLITSCAGVSKTRNAIYLIEVLELI